MVSPKRYCVLSLSNIFKFFFCFSLEISEKIKRANPLLDNEQKAFFYNQVKEKLSFLSNDLNNISWQDIVLLEAMNSIREHKQIFAFLNKTLFSFYYPQTSMHGEFNPENILIDFDSKFWVVEWENSTL